MNWRDIASIIAISAAISSIISLSLQAYFRARFEKYFEDYSKSLERRKRILAKVSELIYRIRNEARKISNQVNPDSKNVEEMSIRIEELREMLFKERLELEKIKIFLFIHEYVVDAESFTIKTLDIIKLMKDGEIQRAHDFMKDLSDLYRELDQSYPQLVEQMVELT